MINVLVVEDHPIAQKIARIVLEDLGYKFDVAKTGMEAVEFFVKNSYHIVFVDIGLPDIDGLTVANTIRNIEKNNQHIPIIALTAHADAHTRELIAEQEIDDCILKPLTSENCLEILNRYVFFNQK